MNRPGWNMVSVDRQLLFGAPIRLNKEAEIALKSTTELFTPIPHGEGQTILREALLLADHNAYHLGQLVLLRRFLGAWDE